MCDLPNHLESISSDFETKSPHWGHRTQLCLKQDGLTLYGVCKNKWLNRMKMKTPALQKQEYLKSSGKQSKDQSEEVICTA